MSAVPQKAVKRITHSLMMSSSVTAFNSVVVAQGLGQFKTMYLSLIMPLCA